jgi:uncharacterized membrane protein
LALFLRIAPLPNESVDGDEMFSLRVALASPADSWNMIRNDLVHPPLYYFLLRATLPAGTAPTATDLRTLSLAAGACTIGVVLLIGVVQPWLRWPGVLAALFLALNKTHIFYSQEARSYSLYGLLVALLLVWATLFPRFSGSFYFWASGCLLASAILWTHYVGAIFCLTCFAPLMIARPNACSRFRARLAPFASLALAFVSFLPWVISEISVYHQRAGLSANLGWQDSPSLYNLKMIYAEYVGILDLPGATTFAFLLVAALIGCALFLRTADETPQRKIIVRTLALAAVAPPLILFLLSRWPWNLPIFGLRHLLPAFVPAMLLLGLGVTNLALRAQHAIRPAIFLALGAAVLCIFQLAPVLQRWPGPVRQPYARVAADILQLGPELPIFTTWHYGIGGPVSFYLPSGWRVYPLQASAASQYPDRFVVLYRPGVPRENEIVQTVCRNLRVVYSRYYWGHLSPKFGTRLLVLAQP